MVQPANMTAEPIDANTLNKMSLNDSQVTMIPNLISQVGIILDL